jgi:hypothetical protein
MAAKCKLKLHDMGEKLFEYPMYRLSIKSVTTQAV